MTDNLISSRAQEVTSENPNCSCPETSCPRHGKCSECQEYHHARDEKTFCGR